MDRRTKRKKLEAMAAQSASPKEAEIAKEKLKDLPPDPEPQMMEFRIIFNGQEINLNNGEFISFTWTTKIM